MFINTQEPSSKNYYEKMLKAAGSLSNLFSQSPQPYLPYRIVENLFCKTFGADNLSRSDCSVDAMKGVSGIGIKTFQLKNGKSFEKIAEFNKELNLFKGLDIEPMVAKIADLRNQRVGFTKRNYRLNEMLYHCVVRGENKVIVYETPMAEVDIDEISGISVKGNIISFKDNLNEYKFNIAKSTLFKQFIAEDVLMNFVVKIVADPFESLERLFDSSVRDIVFSPIREEMHIFLPLYSGHSGEKAIHEKSGLNLWNAGGRRRDPNEIYIPIPAWVHKRYPGFFPPRDTTFNLLLPNGNALSASICQDGSKALMTNPNAALGQWLLRDVLNISPGELLTYEKLESLGLDSVVIYKKGANTFDINFAKIGSFESFIGEVQLEEHPDEENI